MATAVKNNTETAPAPMSQHRLLIASAIGAAYLVIGFAAVGLGLHFLLTSTPVEQSVQKLSLFFSYAVIGLPVTLIIGGLIIMGILLTRSNSPDGARGGAFIVFCGAIVWFLITVAAGQLLERYLLKSADARNLGLGLTAVIGVGLLVAAIRYMLKPQFSDLVLKFDSQNWFRPRFYKPNQGLWVRRLSLAGIFLIIITGVGSMHEHHSLGMIAGEAWKIRIPFLFIGNRPAFAQLFPAIAAVAPVLIAVVGAWFSWRAVNYPVFADFLIASEAEMHKVSWSTRKKLIQDTIVVLTTVILFTIFLLAVDQVWGWVLSRKAIGIVPQAKPSDASKVENVELDY